MLGDARQKGTVVLEAYNVVLKMLAMEQWMADDSVKLMEKLVCQLKADGLEPNMFTYNSIIYVYAQARSAGKAQRTYDELVSRGLEPNALTLSNLVMAQSWQSHSEMCRTLAQMDERGWLPTRSAHVRVLAAMWQVKNAKGVLQTMRRMLDMDQQPNEAGFAMGLMAAGRLGEADFAEEIFARRARSGLEPKEEIYGSMMLAHAKANQHEECLEYWRQLVCVDGIGGVNIHLDTYHCALKAAVTVDQWDEMEAILDLMKAHGITPSEHTFKAAIGACKARKGADGPEHLECVERVVEAIRSRGKNPSDHVQLLVAIACVHAKAWGKAAPLFESAMARNCEMWPFAWECVFRTLVAQERFAKVKEAWVHTASEEGGSPYPRVNELAMTAAQHLRDADWALQILSAGREAKTKSSPTMQAIAMKVLAQAGRLQEARDVLKESREGGKHHLNHMNMNKLLSFCELHGNTEIGLEFLQELRSKSPPHRLQPSNMAFAIAALSKHGRAGEVVTLFEEQLEVKYQARASCYALVANAAFLARDRANTVKYSEEARVRGDTAAEEALAFAREDGQSVEGTTRLVEALDPVFGKVEEKESAGVLAVRGT